MTTDLTFLLSKGFVPIVRHNSGSFRFLEDEARKASAAVLGEEVAFHVLRSDKSNAYVVRTPTRFFIGITDTLLQDLSFDILDLLGQSDIAEFFANECGYPYDVREAAPTRESLDAFEDADPADKPARTQEFDNPKIRLFNSIFFNGMKVFLLLHEIAHIKFNHFDLTTPGATYCELPETLAETADSARLDKEREADTAATCWRAQQIVRLVRAHPSAGPKTYWLELASAFLGAILPLRKTAGLAGSQAHPATHPLPQERVQNIAFWFTNVGSQDYDGVPAEQQMRFLNNIIILVERTVRGLDWPAVDWKGSHFNPYPYMQKTTKGD